MKIEIIGEVKFKTKSDVVVDGIRFEASKIKTLILHPNGFRHIGIYKEEE